MSNAVYTTGIYELQPDIVHAMGVQNPDFTVCGWADDIASEDDDVPAEERHGDWIPDKRIRPINCSDCARIVRLARQISIAGECE